MAQKTVNELLLDALIRHQTYLLRYSGSLRNRMNGMLARTEDTLGMLIRDKLRNATGLSSSSEVRRMEALLEAVTTLRNGAWADANTFLLDEMAELGYQEPIHMSGVLQAVAPVVVETVLPPARQLRAIVNSRPFDGALLKDWAAGLQREDIRRIHGAIQLGMIAGEGSEAIARRVIGKQDQVSAVFNHLGQHLRARPPGPEPRHRGRIRHDHPVEAQLAAQQIQVQRL